MDEKECFMKVEFGKNLFVKKEIEILAFITLRYRRL